MSHSDKLPMVEYDNLPPEESIKNKSDKRTKVWELIQVRYWWLFFLNTSLSSWKLKSSDEGQKTLLRYSRQLPQTADVLSFLTCSNNRIFLYSCVCLWGGQNYLWTKPSWKTKQYFFHDMLMLTQAAACVLVYYLKTSKCPLTFAALKLMGCWLIDKILKCFKRADTCQPVWEQRMVSTPFVVSERDTDFKGKQRGTYMPYI